ncbi:SidC homolog [Legionella steigerwaltii]|uniref:SidC homolog n=1 Tax=Legionella steigerwaltii TaxID=460 RepID=A0A378L426_9GAMM|nr:ankyrin repeat domain-containing protein [Legionella steigerwaltii]KTD75382.1 hypothetical protein Lstg_2477 [Legionella steigerwaltii]STY21524.1 SidC homolog [Legionella steigerwaltii]
MPIILFDDNRISESELKTHNRLLQDILSGKLHTPQIKKLVGMAYQGNAVYRAKINDKIRLIFTYQIHEEQNTLLVLGVMDDHNYAQLKKQLEASKTTKRYLAMDLAPKDNESPVNIESKPITFKPTIPYKGKTLVLDESQDKARQNKPPLVLLGPPGAGKTSTLYNIMWRYVNNINDNSVNPAPVLFLSSSKHLVTLHEGLYQADKPNNQYTITFSTWHDLLQSHYPQSTPVHEAFFAQWLQKQPIEGSSKIIHYELSLIAALGAEKYLKLCARQCYYFDNKPKQELLIKLLDQWQAHLAESKLFDPIVTPLNPERTQPYTAIYLDETQNLPPIALKSLIPLAMERHFVSSLDSEQCLLSSPYIHNCLKELLYLYYGKNYTEQLLTYTWRCPRKVTEVGNHLMKTKYDMDNGNQRRVYKDIVSKSLEKGIVSWLNTAGFPAIKYLGALAGTAVIAFHAVSSEERLLINEQLGTNNILSPEQAIGLDFDTVILWNPVSKVNAISSLTKKNPADQLTLDQWNALNALYVSITRAQKHVFFYDEQPKHWKNLTTQLMGELPLNQFDALEPGVHATPEAERAKWQAQVSPHLQEGNIVVARGIMEFNLGLNPQEIENQINLAKPYSPKMTTPIISNPETKPQDSVKNANEPPTKSKKPKASSKKKASASSSTKDKEFDYIKKLVNLYIGGDFSALKKLLESPKVEHYLFEVPLKEFNSSGYQFNSNNENLFAWLAEWNPSILTTIFLNLLASLEKTNTSISLPLLKTMCRIENNKTPSLLSLVFFDIITTPKYQKLIQFLMKTQRDEDKKNYISTCLNAPTEKGLTPAGFCVEKGLIAGLEVLCKLGVNLGTSLSEGLPLSVQAIRKGQLKILKALDQLGVNLNTPLETGATPLFFAAMEGNLEIAQFLLTKQEKPIPPFKTSKKILISLLCEKENTANNELVFNRLNYFITGQETDDENSDPLIELYPADVAWIKGHLHLLPLLLPYSDKIRSFMKGEPQKEKDMSALLGIYKGTHTLFKPDKLDDLSAQLLLNVATGKQDMAEKIVSMHPELLLARGTVTDYSGRTFENISAYEYAYWAKDTHMCRMLEKYMNAETKAAMLKRCENIEKIGLSYKQHGKFKISNHFDFTPLKTALKNYIDVYNYSYDINKHGEIQGIPRHIWKAGEDSWTIIGKEQRDLPAHVVNEYCRNDRSFDPTPTFEEDTLPRELTYEIVFHPKREEPWFPLAISDSKGLGVDFAIYKTNNKKAQIMYKNESGAGRYDIKLDLLAIDHLDKVRTDELKQSLENLKSVEPRLDKLDF